MTTTFAELQITSADLAEAIRSSGAEKRQNKLEVLIDWIEFKHEIDQLIRFGQGYTVDFMEEDLDQLLWSSTREIGDACGLVFGFTTFQFV